MQQPNFDIEDDEAGSPSHLKKKQRYSSSREEDNSMQVEGRSLFCSPSPIGARARPLANFNPFVEVPSLLSESTAGISPEPFSSSFDVEEDESSPSRDGLAKEFRKTLSFVDFDEEENSDPREAASPATPPSSLQPPRVNFPQSVVKSVRVLHKPHKEGNPTSRFEDEFEIKGRLGNGSFGTVYKVKKRLDGCQYAVKVVNQAFLGQSGRERVLKEVYALAAVVNNSDNPHIVRYFSSWIDIDDRLYIQTELCDFSLEHLLHEGSLKNGSSNIDIEKSALDILRQLLKGLQGLHESNVVHLDIKPANILVKNGVYKLGDLGHVAMARFVRPSLPAPPPLRQSGSASITRTRPGHPNEEDERQRNAAMLVVQDIDEGDVRYMPRELLSETYDHLPKADIFSLAASVYEIFLQRTLPSNGDEWAELREGQFASEATKRMSNNMRELLLHMMDVNPARRPSADTLLRVGGPGGILFEQHTHGRDKLFQEAMLRGLHTHAVLRRANTM